MYFARVQSMLIQQLKSSKRKIEAVGVQSLTGWLREDSSHKSFAIGTPYITLSNYNIQHKNISYTNGKDLLQECLKNYCIKPLLNPHQQLPTNLLQECQKSCHIGLVQSLNQIWSYFEYFSQSTVCIATRFGEGNTTLLNKLWYLYSYIYKPTTTIQYRIYILLNSWYTSTF